MHSLIDIKVKFNNRWVYVEGTRMHRTLAAAVRHYLHAYGLAVKASFS